MREGLEKENMREKKLAVVMLEAGEKGGCGEFFGV